MKNAGVFFSLSLMLIFVICCFLLLNIQIENYSMLQRRTKNDFKMYTPVSYVTNKIHSYDQVNCVQVQNVERRKVIKLSDSQSDTYLYKEKSNLMEVCVVSGMNPDFKMGQILMPVKSFNVKQDQNTIICTINGITFQVELRSGDVS